MNERGFTLIELVFVAAVMAVLAAVAGPAVARSFRHWSGEMSVDRFVQLTDYARERAVVDGKTVRLSIEPSSESFALKTGDGGDFRPLPGRWGRRNILPEGMSVKTDPFDIDFFPNGTSLSAQVTFTFPDGEERSFNLRPLLGRLEPRR